MKFREAGMKPEPDQKELLEMKIDSDEKREKLKTSAAAKKPAPATKKKTSAKK